MWQNSPLQKNEVGKTEKPKAELSSGRPVFQIVPGPCRRRPTAASLCSPCSLGLVFHAAHDLLTYIVQLPRYIGKSRRKNTGA